MLKILIFICIFVDIRVGSNFKKKCNSEEILRIICPPFSTNCVEDDPLSANGTCECIKGVFNPEYTNDENYCLNSIDVNSYKNETKPKIERSLHTHHIFAGVSISLAFVLIVSGCIFVCKKFHVNQRLRNIRRTHCRPFYEDVMLGTNDDDPPLI